MRIEIHRKHSLKTTQWSGGTTTQLAIYPAGAEYSKRQFQFRLSTAKVDNESSEFTALPGVSRIIMILKGELVLEHIGHYKKCLKTFETDTFQGDWQSRSQGRVTDFNLMTTGNVQGSVHLVAVEKGAKLDTVEVPPHAAVAFYAVEGNTAVHLPTEILQLKQGDMVLLFGENRGGTCELQPAEGAKIVQASMQNLQ